MAQKTLQRPFPSSSLPPPTNLAQKKQKTNHPYLTLPSHPPHTPFNSQPILSLPVELLLQIFSLLPPSSLASLALCSRSIYILTTTSSLYRSLDLSNLRSTSFHDCKLPPKLHSYLQLASSVTITSPTELSIYHVLHILHAASTSERLQHVSLTALSSARCYTPSFISFFHHCGGGLKHVNLSFMSVISSTVLALFASNPCLETLILGFTDIDESVLPAFSSARKLSELDISGCFYLDKRLLRAFLRSGLPPALRKLGMRNMVDLKIGWVYDLLMEPCPGDLEVVDLGCCGVRRGDLEVVRGLWKGVKVMGEGLEGGETRWGIKRSRDVVRRRI